ncbi:MAG: type II toxin-antitoxin system RelE/ParE family toxin [Deltaproteobacteria bacterium]|nr:type II toxin-antitoxin system RelE/ParE family toxin [Deltaproteobacteria bacterium]
MSRSLRWFPEAVSDLARLRDFIRIHNPDASQRVARLIRDTAHKLLMFPFIGMPVQDIDHPQLRDLFIPFAHNGYWLRYTVTDYEIIVVRIWHGRENRNQQ